MLTEISFLVLAFVILIASLKMLNAKELMHAAVWLGLVLAGVAGIYLTLGAELLAAIQILIYVGAVLTLMLFAIMFVEQGSPTEGFAEDRTPLSLLGIQAPVGMDVESMADVPDDVETVADAEAAAAAGTVEDEASDASEDAEPAEDPDVDGAGGVGDELPGEDDDTTREEEE